MNSSLLIHPSFLAPRRQTFLLARRPHWRGARTDGCIRSWLFDLWGGYGWFGLGKNYFPKPLVIDFSLTCKGVTFFFFSIGYFFPRCFLAIIFSPRNQFVAKDIFAEITHTNPLPSPTPPQKLNSGPHSNLGVQQGKPSNNIGGINAGIIEFTVKLIQILRKLVSTTSCLKDTGKWCSAL